jgi:ADP-ribose pyrophosphatase YjhB (NUDIX family)
MNNDLPLKEFIAAKGVLVHAGKVLFLRESGSYVEGTNVGKYDVSGGRLNPDETWVDGLRREVAEETGFTVDTAVPFFVRDWRVNRPVERWHIHAVFFAVPVMSPEVILSTDHDHYVWLDPRTAQAHIPLMAGYDAMLGALVERNPGLFR